MNRAMIMPFTHKRAIEISQIIKNTSDGYCWRSLLLKKRDRLS